MSGPSGAHTHPSSGGDLAAMVVVMIVAAVVVTRVLGPVADAVGQALGELMKILIITGGCVLTALVAGGGGLLFWRRRHPRQVRPAPWKAEVVGQAPAGKPAMAALPSRVAAPAAPPAALPPPEVHNHWHLPEGLDADALARAIVRAQRDTDPRP